MKKIIIGILAVILMVSTGIPVSAEETELEKICLAGDSLNKTTAEVYTSEELGTLPYRLYRSPKNVQSGNATPDLVLLYLHGLGERGDDNKSQITGLQTNYHYLISDYCEDRYKDINYVVIAPQCRPNDQWVTTNFQNTTDTEANAITDSLRLAHEITMSYGGKGTEFVVFGVSMGGYGTWDLITRYPGKYAAAMPMCGAGDVSKVSLLAKDRIWFFHCADDAAVPVKVGRAMKDALAGVNALAKYTEYATGGHAVWNMAAKSENDPTVTDWLVPLTMDSLYYNVTADCSDYGKISEAVTDIARGGSASFVITPEQNYKIGFITVDGERLEAPELTDNGDGTFTYKVENVKSNMHVSVDFAFDKIAEKENTSKSVLPIIAAAAAVCAACVAAVTAILLKHKKKKA